LSSYFRKCLTCTFDFEAKIVFICYYILLIVFYLPQPQPDEQHVSSAEDEDEDGDGDAVAKDDVPVDEEEEDKDPLINNSSEQLDNIRFDGGQLIDGYNYRYVLLVYFCVSMLNPPPPPPPPTHPPKGTVNVR
jgi:hypothetical protein